MKAGLLRLPALCIAAVILLTFGSASAEGLDVSAKGAVLIESRTGKVLYAKNAHEKLPMASTTNKRPMPKIHFEASTRAICPERVSVSGRSILDVALV